MIDLKKIKQLFMAYRNGIVADTLRNAFTAAGNNPYHIIFGLNLPQLSTIARMAGKDAEDINALARELWQDSTVRESRLLACYLFDIEMPQAEALMLAADIQTPEEADILCLRFLSRRPDKEVIASILAQYTNNPLLLRCATRLS